MPVGACTNIRKGNTTTCACYCGAIREQCSDGLRRQARGDRTGDASDDFHDAVEDAFDALAAGEPDRFLVVDAMMDLDDVVDAVMGDLVGAP